MQFGIIAYAATTGSNGLDKVTMGLVDYQSLPQKNTVNVKLAWERKEGKEYGNVSVEYIDSDIHAIGTTGKILKCLETLKKYLNDPASLVGVIQKQLARQVVWDERIGEYVMTKRLKDEETRFEVLVDNKPIKIIPAEDEDDAIVKAIKSLASGDPDILTKFVTQRKVRKLESAEGAPPTFVPINVYARRSASK